MWIVRRRGSVTAKALGKRLRCRASYKFLPRQRTFTINYGGKYPNANLNAFVESDKLKTHMKLVSFGVSMPKVYLKGEIIPDNAFPLLARKKYHSQGKDVIYIANRRQLEEDMREHQYDYLIEYINKSSEYRVHILGDDAFVSVKFDGFDPIVRSHSNGWKQIEYTRKWHDELIMLATKAIDVLGYDFGAVDIIRRKNKLYVLEVNSSPGLEPRKLELYSNFFKKKESEWKNENWR